MMDFITRLQQLCLQALMTASPIGDNTFIAHLCSSLCGATQSTIASYLNSPGTVDTNTINHICAILLDHKVVLKNLHLGDLSALLTNPSSGCRDQNRHDLSLSSSLSHAPKPQSHQQPQQNYSAQIPQHDSARHCKEHGPVLQFHLAPSHTIHNCNANS